jgi:palmitoyltransferase ZDHHC9/14/18
MYAQSDTQYGVQPATTTATANHQRTLSSGRNRSNSRISRFSGITRPLSPQSQSSAGPMSPPRSAPLPTPKGFYSPKKPAAALRLEQKEKRDTARRQVGENDAVMLSALEEMSPGHEEDSRIDVSRHDFEEARSERTNSHYRNSLQSIEFQDQPENRYPPPAPVGTSLTEVTSHPRTSQRSSDDLVHRSKEKASSELPTYRKPSKKERERRYKAFENPLTTFFLNGHLMTGGDAWYSAILALILLFGMTGVWLGTTGVWMWRHGTEYGLAKGGGIAVTIVFVYVLSSMLG